MDCDNWFYLCCGFLVLMLALFAMSLKYNLELTAKYIKLKQKLAEVEWLNGKEKRDIAELQNQVKELKLIIKQKT